MKPTWVKYETRLRGLSERWHISTGKYWIEITAPSEFHEEWTLHTSFPSPWEQRLKAQTLKDAKTEAVELIREVITRMNEEINTLL